MGVHPFSKLDQKTRRRIMALEGIRSRRSFLDRVYFFKGPVLQEMSAVLTDRIFAILKDYTYDNVEGIKNDLFRRIEEMCPGRIDLKDKPIVNSDIAEQLETKHKSIDPDFIGKIIEANKPGTAKQMVDDDRPISTPQGRILVSNELISRYKIMPTRLDKEKLKKVHQFLKECDSLHNDDLKITYLQKFNDFSKRFNLYSDIEFLDFLEKQIKIGTNKHVVLECLFILHNLILSSKIEQDDSFLSYVKKHYFSFLKERLESGDQTYEYSVFKIEQIFYAIENFIEEDEICEMYWKRLVGIVKSGDYSANRIGHCTDALNKNKCHLKPEWRKWLITEDKYSGIKNEIMKEFPHSAFV
jgi:hypothetical protein